MGVKVFCSVLLIDPFRDVGTNWFIFPVDIIGTIAEKIQEYFLIHVRRAVGVGKEHSVSFTITTSW